MKRAIMMCVAASLLLGGCAQPKTICGVQYQSYGFLNSDDLRNPDVQYKVSIGSLVLAIIFFETVIVPIYVFGFDIMEPVGRKPAIKGAVGTAECV